TTEKSDSTEGADQAETNNADQAEANNAGQVETNNANADAGKTVETATATDTGSQGITPESSTASSSAQSTDEADAQKAAETQVASQEAETTTFNVSESGQGDANAAVLTDSKATKTSGQSTGSTPDKNGVDTTWARDKSAKTGNSDTNSDATEAGEYWPDTQGHQLKGLSGVTTTSDFTAGELIGKLDDEYSGTPLAKYNRDISLYIKGQKVDTNTLTDDDSLGKQNGKNVVANPNFPNHASKGHARLIKTGAFGPDTYFFARNAVSVYNQDTGKYENYDVKWTLQSANYSVGTSDASNAAVNSSDGTTDNQITSYGFGVKGSEDAGGNLLFNVGSGWQKMGRGNFLNTHMQLFKEVDSKVFENNESVDDAIKNGHLVATAANIHLGFSDIDSDEAVELTKSAIKKTIVSDASVLAYQVTDDGYLAVTRSYGTTVGAGTTKNDQIAPKDAMVLFELSVPKEGIDVSYTTVGPRTGQDIGPGSKIDPTSMTGIEYNQPLIVNYYELNANGSKTTTQLKDTETYHGKKIGDPYPDPALNPPATITTSDGTTWYLNSSMTYNSHPDDANHYKYKGGYSDATNVINYYYESPTVVVKPGGNWPDNAQTKVDLTKDVTRTIKYVDAKTNAQVADPVTQTVKFGRTAVVRKNTGELVGFDTNGDGVADITAVRKDTGELIGF
ncbi:MAG: hypothetical protein ACI4VD_05595, partial [Limosilactobacillus mucosae]